MHAATSSAVSGRSTPAYTAAALSSSPPKRLTANSSVRTIPGAISITRTGTPASSSRNVSVSACCACLAAL